MPTPCTRQKYGYTFALVNGFGTGVYDVPKVLWIPVSKRHGAGQEAGQVPPGQVPEVALCWAGNAAASSKTHVMVSPASITLVAHSGLFSVAVLLVVTAAQLPADTCVASKFCNAPFVLACTPQFAVQPTPAPKP